MKPRYKYKPKRAFLDEEGRSYRDFDELDFGSGSGPGSGPGSGQTPTKNRRRKKKPDPKTDIKALVS